MDADDASGFLVNFAGDASVRTVAFWAELNDHKSDPLASSACIRGRKPSFRQLWPGRGAPGKEIAASGDFHGVTRPIDCLPGPGASAIREQPDEKWSGPAPRGSIAPTGTKPRPTLRKRTLVRSWIVLAALAIARIAFGYQFQAVATLGPDLVTRFHLSYTAF